MPASFNNAKLPLITMGLAIPAVVIMRFLVGFDGLYGQDGYEYFRYAKALKTFMVNGTNPGDYFWPVGYPLSGALLSFIVQDVGFALQLISALSLALVFIFSYKIIRFLFPETIHSTSLLFSLLFILLSPFILRFGFSVMADMLTLACMMMSTYYFLKAGKNGSTGALIVGGLMATFACTTRYAAFIVLAPGAFYGYWMFFRKSKNPFNALSAIIIGIIPALPHFLIRESHSADFIQHDWVSHWSIFNFIKKDFYTRDGVAHNSYPNIIYSLGGLFHPRYCFAAAFILLIGFRRIKLKSELLVIFIGLLLYLLFLCGIPYQNNRFLLIALPFFILTLYNPWQTFVHKQKKVLKTIVITVIITGQVILFPVGFKAVYDRNQLENNLYIYLSGINSPDVYAMDIDISLTGRGYHGKVYNMYTHYYEQPDTNGLVIFNTVTMPVQWKGMNPIKNWQHFNELYQLKEVKNFNHGWTVYQFK